METREERKEKIVKGGRERHRFQPLIGIDSISLPSSKFQVPSSTHPLQLAWLQLQLWMSIHLHLSTHCIDPRLFTSTSILFHQVRHAQGIHNVIGDKDYKAYMSPHYFDAHLTPLGWNQVENLRKHVHSCGLAKRIDVVFTSPLLRTMQTAVGVFGGEAYTDNVDALPLMLANAGNSCRSAISSLNCPPIIAVELCREHLGVHPCDRRRSISEYQCLFPAIDFSLIESDEDVLWKPDIRETKEELAIRGKKFFNWLWTRKEKEIAIVTHSGFLFHTLATFGNDCHPLVKKEITKHFANCELRSMVIVDKSMLGSDSSTTDYPGRIPSGPDIPSDSVDEKFANDKPVSGST